MNARRPWASGRRGARRDIAGNVVNFRIVNNGLQESCSVIVCTFLGGTLEPVDKTTLPRTPLDFLARVIVALEAVLMAAITAAYASYAVLDPESGRFLWGAFVICAIFTAGMAAVAWGFSKGKRFALGSAFLWQLMQVSAGVWLLGSNPAVGIPLLVSAGIVGAAIMKRVARLPGQADDMDDED